MSAETLRKAASLMRERAEGATAGPWFAVASGVEGAGTVLHDKHVLHNDAEHIATWHPAVALIVADWLEVTARDVGTSSLAFHAALAAARAYLGESA